MRNLSSQPNNLVQKIIRYCQKKGIRVSRHYSGRGMFGKECIAFYGTARECTTIAEFIKRKTAYSYNYDQFGLDWIYYFPDIEDERKNRNH
jgi:hypothetical protein